MTKQLEALVRRLRLTISEIERLIAQTNAFVDAVQPKGNSAVTPEKQPAIEQP